MGKILITGSTGFIGRHLVNALASESRRLVLLVRRSSKLDLLPDSPFVDFLWLDESEPFGDHRQISDLEGVIHLATHYVKDHDADSILPLVSANITLGTQVLDLATRSGARWFMNVGSMWQHHDIQLRNAANLYAATKNAFEEVLGFYVRSKGIQGANFYIGDTYGPGDTRRKIMKLWSEASNKSETVPMSPGRQKIDVLHVSDVVSALVKVSLNPYRYCSKSPAIQSFSIGAPSLISLRELADVFRQATGSDLKLDWGALPYRDGEVMNPSVPFPRLPGWAPRIELEEGLRTVYGRLKANGPTEQVVQIPGTSPKGSPVVH